MSVRRQRPETSISTPRLPLHRPDAICIYQGYSLNSIRKTADGDVILLVWSHRWLACKKVPAIAVCESPTSGPLHHTPALTLAKESADSISYRLVHTSHPSSQEASQPAGCGKGNIDKIPASTAVTGFESKPIIGHCVI